MRLKPSPCSTAGCPHQVLPYAHEIGERICLSCKLTQPDLFLDQVEPSLEVLRTRHDSKLRSRYS